MDAAIVLPTRNVNKIKGFSGGESGLLAQIFTGLAPTHGTKRREGRNPDLSLEASRETLDTVDASFSSCK